VSRADPHVITGVRSHDRSAVSPPSRARNVRDPARRPGVETPILASKITVPGVPGWAVPRPRVTKLIAEGTRWCPLTVVTGPPGAGKTMALAQWAAAEPEVIAWVSSTTGTTSRGSSGLTSSRRCAGPVLAFTGRCRWPRGGER
jgi:hypothetical protein